MNVLKYQHNVFFNDEPKSCLSNSSDDRRSIKSHNPKCNAYNVLLSVQLLLCRVVNCSPVHHLSLFLYF